jgi:hypothetical protein
MYTLGKERILQVLAALLLITVVGGAAALWSETLRINFEINTGEVDVEWSDYWTNETGYGEQTKPWVANCTVEPEIFDDGGPIKLLVTIENGYPSFTCELYATVDNIGTIPVKAFSYTLTGNASNMLDVTHNLTDLIGYQIDAGENATVVITVHVPQSAAENAYYEMELEILFGQWNEYTTTTAS